jgi:outer membrane lipoprotein SlyB
MHRVLLLLLPLLLAACAGAGTHGVNADHPQQPVPPLLGTVDSVTPVDLPNEGGSAGAVIGGTAGAVGGANTGEGRGRYAASILGGVLGSLAGDALQNSGTHPGVEIWVRLDNGKSTVVRQALSQNDTFAVGDRVQVVNDKTGAHVVHLPVGKP